jgi:chorismate synthase
VNIFGRQFRVSIFGESHGEGPGIVVDGCPAGLPLAVEDFLEDLERRKGGTQKGTTPRKEDDLPIFKSGIFNGLTTGAPIAIFFENKNTRSGDYAKQRDVPRPGHADFVASKKYGGYEDYRGGGHFSGRLTVCLVAAGVIAKKLLKVSKSGTFSSNISVASTILEIGGETDLEKGLEKAIEQKDSVGGIVECRVNGLPVGIGEPFWDSVESVISHAVFAIPAVRGIEFGTGFAAAKMFGADHNDAIDDITGKTITNHAGGVVGGITNSNEFVFRIAIKPTSSTPKDQFTLNWKTGQKESFSVKGRHDLCIALRVPPVLEAVTAITLADLLMQEHHIPRVLHIMSPGEHSKMDHFIYHVTTPEQWELARKEGFYLAPSLLSEGFIHLCKPHQLQGVLDRYFPNRTGLLLLTVDPSKLTVPFKYELAPSLKEWFPHIFGSISLDAIVNAEHL